MARPFNPDITIDWKITLPAPIAGRVRHLLLDTTTGKASYGSRSKIIASLLEEWIARQTPGAHPFSYLIDAAKVVVALERLNTDPSMVSALHHLNSAVSRAEGRPT